MVPTAYPAALPTGRAHSPRHGVNTNVSPHNSMGQPSSTSTRDGAGGGLASAPDIWHKWAVGGSRAWAVHPFASTSPGSTTSTASQTAGGLWKHKPSQHSPYPTLCFQQQNNSTGHLSHGNRNALAANRSSWCTTHACAGTRDVPSSHLTAASALRPGLSGDALSCSQGLLHAKPQSYTENKLIYRDSLACWTAPSTCLLGIYTVD